MEDDALPNSGPSTPISSTCTSPTSCGSIDQYLPKVIPSCTTLIITKQSILELAVLKLGVKLHKIQITDMNNDELLGSVCMDVPPHREYPYTSQQEFFGKYTPWKKEAVESACSTALDYLTKVGVLIIEDANYANLNICQTELQKLRFWEDAFRSRVISLQAAFGKSVQANHYIDISDDSDIDDQPDRVLQTETTPHSFYKIPYHRNKDVTSTSTARKALFQGETSVHDDGGGSLAKKARN